MVVFTGLTPAKALGGRGIGSVAIGFAFRDIFKNPVDILQSRAEVVTAVKRAFDDAGIEIPFPYRTLTFKVSLRTQVGQRGINANKNPEYLASSPGKFLVCAHTYDWGGDFYFFHHHCTR